MVFSKRFIEYKYLRYKYFTKEHQKEFGKKRASEKKKAATYPWFIFPKKPQGPTLKAHRQPKKTNPAFGLTPPSSPADPRNRGREPAASCPDLVCTAAFPSSCTKPSGAVTSSRLCPSLCPQQSLCRSQYCCAFCSRVTNIVICMNPSRGKSTQNQGVREPLMCSLTLSPFTTHTYA